VVQLSIINVDFKKRELISIEDYEYRKMPNTFNLELPVLVDYYEPGLSRAACDAIREELKSRG